MRRCLISIIGIAALSIAFAACSNQNTANERNFTTAIDAFLNTGTNGVICQTSPVNEFPWPLPGAAFWQGYGLVMKEQLEHLETAGIIRKEQETYTDRTMFLSSEKKTGMVYDLTSLGKRGQVVTQGVMGGTTTAFCFAHLGVDKIVQFTVPGTENGMTISKVTAALKVAKIDDWAKPIVNTEPEFVATMQDLVGKNLEFMLTLTNNGWKAAR